MLPSTHQVLLKASLKRTDSTAEYDFYVGRYAFKLEAIEIRVKSPCCLDFFARLTCGYEF